MSSDITWKDTIPYSQRFDDIYFNPENGLSETHHVFIGGNDLHERFTSLRAPVIAELGFGTGLNLLAAWELFLQRAPADAMLHYISFERFPLSAEEMLKAAAAWPGLLPLAQNLFTGLKLFGEGIYRLHAHRLTLTLVIGDAGAWLKQLRFAADAWFLDGFAPAKNPEMWNDALLAQVAAHTAPGGSCATFTAAGAVRRALSAGGFEMSKVPGFGRKREMLIGRMGGAPSPRDIPSHVRIAGGGIAGCAAAYSLARRGIRVVLHEPHAIASGASGNAAGALYPLLHRQHSPAMQAYGDALRYLRHLLPRLSDVSHRFCGMLKLPAQEGDDADFPHLPTRLGAPPQVLRWLDAQEASDAAGIVLQSGGLWMEHSAILSPPDMCRALLAHPNIEVVTAPLAPDESDAPTIIACGMGARKWYPGLKLHINRGQVSLIAPQHVQATLRCAVSHRGYALPLTDGRLMLGATYARHDEDLTLRAADHEENLSTACHHLPGLLAPHAVAEGGRAALRCVTPNRMPMVGKTAPQRYLSVGHGSRGLLSGVLAGEYLADAICDTPLPLSLPAANAWGLSDNASDTI